MAGYIASNDNRFYVVKEPSFGIAGTVSAGARFAASSVQLAVDTVYPQRRDKTGSRTRAAAGQPLRRGARFAIKSYLTASSAPGQAPGCGPLVEAAMGANAVHFSGAVVESAIGPAGMRTAAPHGLSLGQGVRFGSELRFVKGITDPQTVQLNAPFTVTPSAGSMLGPTMSYGLSRDLPSVSVYDYWGGAGAIQRIACGAMVDRMRIGVNGDVHDLEFAGLASDVIDSTSFQPGQAGLGTYPDEPAVTGSLGMAPVPGHLGQAWLGVAPEQCFTVTKAMVELRNNVEMRASEFGSVVARCGMPGDREVRFDCLLYGRGDALTRGLYQAAREGTPIELMLQLGQQAGQLMGVFARSVRMEVPQLEDREARLQWKFSGAVAQGMADDELFVAFG